MSPSGTSRPKICQRSVTGLPGDSVRSAGTGMCSLLIRARSRGSDLKSINARQASGLMLPLLQFLALLELLVADAGRAGRGRQQLVLPAPNNFRLIAGGTPDIEFTEE